MEFENLAKVENTKYQVPPKFFQTVMPALVLLVLIRFAKCVKFVINLMSTASSTLKKEQSMKKKLNIKDINKLMDKISKKEPSEKHIDELFDVLNDQDKKQEESYF